MRRPASRDLEGIDVAIAGIPFDSGTNYCSGARFGPRKIREAYLLLWGYNQVMQVVPGEVLQIVDYSDFDAVDPAYASDTVTPEVGGFSSFQMLQLVRGLKGLYPAGFDLVEVCPPYDHSGITSILAANLVFEFLSLLAFKGKQFCGKI